MSESAGQTGIPGLLAPYLAATTTTPLLATAAHHHQRRIRLSSLDNISFQSSIHASREPYMPVCPGRRDPKELSSVHPANLHNMSHNMNIPDVSLYNHHPSDSMLHARTTISHCTTFSTSAQKAINSTSLRPGNGCDKSGACTYVHTQFLGAHVQYIHCGGVAKRKRCTQHS